MARRKLEVAGMLAGVEIEVAGKPHNAGQGLFKYYVQCGIGNGNRNEHAQLKCAELAGLSNEAAEIKFCSMVVGSRGYNTAIRNSRPNTNRAAESEPAGSITQQREWEYVLSLDARYRRPVALRSS